MFSSSDAASRRELLVIIAMLADSQPDPLVANLLPSLLNSGVISKSGEPRYCRQLASQVLIVELSLHTDLYVTLTLLCCSKSSGSAAFVGLSWTCKLASSVFSAPEKREGALWKKLVSQNKHQTFFNDNHCVEHAIEFEFLSVALEINKGQGEILVG